MKWIEEVNLCTSDDNTIETILRSQIRSHVESIRRSPECKEALIMHQPNVIGSFNLIVLWSGFGPPRKSRELLMLTEFLNSYGFVYHTLWTELNMKSQMSEMDNYEVPKNNDE